MELKREQLIPSSDLSEFYKEKIAIGLRIIYITWPHVVEDITNLKKINSELHQIFKQIRYRLIRFELTDKINEYESINNAILRLKPYVKERILDKYSGEMLSKNRRTGDFFKYYKKVEEKESLIYDCLDILGLFGSVRVDARRLR